MANNKKINNKLIFLYMIKKRYAKEELFGDREVEGGKLKTGLKGKDVKGVPCSIMCV